MARNDSRLNDIKSNPLVNKYINEGYILNEDATRLVNGSKFIIIGKTRGRRKIYTVTATANKVKNPETGRMIKTNTYKFNKLTKRYFYDASSNAFTKEILDPKTKNKILMNSAEFKKRISGGYIYDEQKNELITPSKKSQVAFGNAFVTYDLNIMSIDDPQVQMKKLNYRIVALLQRSLKKLNGIKFNIGFGIEFTKTDNELIEVNQMFYISAKIQQVLHESDITAAINNQNNDIGCKIDRYTVGGSGWVVGRIVRHQINIYQNELIRAKGYIKLLNWINNKKATVNIQNNDDKCFVYCLGRRYDPNPEKQHLERVNKHLNKVCSELGFDQIKTPVKVEDIGKIAKHFAISVNLYGHNDSIYPIKIHGKVVDDSKHIDLLITTNDDDTHHYVWIKDFDKLCYAHTRHKAKKHFCKNCIQCFTTKEVLEKHKPDCTVLNDCQAVKLPKEGALISFNHLQNTVPIPFVIYADFESLVPKYEGPKENNNSSWTRKHQKHNVCSYGYKIVCCYDDKYSQPYKSYRGQNAACKFLEAIFEEEKNIDKYLREFSFTKMNLTQDDWKNYDNAKICYVCKGEFSDENKKVRDHCHVTGKYRGAACNKCNLSLKLSHKIPVIFHNLKGYDSHLLMQEIGKFKRDLNVIPNNIEKYLMFSVGTEKLCYDFKEKKEVLKLKHDLTFIDSFQFLSSGLDELVENLKDEGKNKFSYMEKEFGNHFELLTQKGIYPYSFMDSWDKFDVLTKDLEKKHFINDLKGDEITDKDFQFYNTVCSTLNIKTLGDYNDLYLKTDVLLLADVFENFRKTCLDYYGLEPCHYFSCPGLAWDACLKMSGINLELISDVDMSNFIEKGLRGCVSVITHTRAIANNRYMKQYDESKPSIYIPYLDTNNLYGWAMKQYLPYGGFKWIKPEDFHLENVRDASEIGHILEVDLEYPKELHDLHNDYPYCPEHLEITPDMLSNYSEKVASGNGMKCGNSNKLVQTLGNKEKYVIHERYLKQVIDAGLVLKAIHRVVEFQQKPWMEKYIDFNTDKRKAASNEFEKDFFKLMNNSVFGKTMENIRKRRNIKLIAESKKFKKYVSKPTFMNGVIFNEDLVAVEYERKCLI